jgi:hypothetical protein
MIFSFVAVRTVEGKIEIHALDERADPALDFHAALKKSKGRDAAGAQLYTDSLLFVRSRKHRSLHFV